jgi:AcrR family transcriptional regulator
VGVGTVYHHFSDKRALLLELLEHYEGTSRAEDWGLGGALAAAFKEADCRSAILVMLRLSIEQRRLRPSLYVVAMELGRRDSEVAALCAQIQTGHRRCIQEAIEAGQKFGTVSLEVEPEAAAFVLLQLFRAAISPISGLPPGVDIEPLVEEFADVLCRYLLVS